MRRLPALVALALVLSPLPARAYDDNDAQFWFTTKLRVALLDQLRLHSEMQIRTGNGMSDIYRYHGEIGLGVRVAKAAMAEVWIDILYRQVFTKGLFWDSPSSIAEPLDAWIAEYRPYLSLTGTLRFGPLQVGDTFKVEPRIYENATHQVRLEDNVYLSVDVPASGGYSFSMFTDFHVVWIVRPGQEFYRTRLYAGFLFPVVGPLSVSLYYMWQRFRAEHGWLDWHILGTGISLSFGKPGSKAGG